MEVRPLKREDFPEVLGLVHEFHAEALDEYSLFCDDDKTLKLMEKVRETSLILEHEGRLVGVIAGVIGEALSSSGKVMQELVWYVSKEYRAKGTLLLKEFERFSKSLGCEKILMVHLGNLNSDVMKRFYERAGYRVMEVHYIKDL